VIEEPDEMRRAELADFLRMRRAAIDPQALGLSVGARRRSPGLLREEVAALAGLSTTWYTYLEQGRPIHPSPAVMSSLSDVLRLNDDERRYVQLLTFGDTTPTTVAAPPEVEVVPGMIDLLSGSPHPFYAGNRYADVVAWNDATATWYTDFGALPDTHRNMLWWMFTMPEARDRLPDWDNEAKDVVARMRAGYPAWADDERMRFVVEELTAASTEFEECWNGQHVAEPRSRLRRLRHPTFGVRSYYLVALRAVDDSFTSYLAHIPMPDDNLAAQDLG
jgi:transcriptional regulator with XRE-family HTH domain